MSEFTRLAVLMYRPGWRGLTVSGRVMSYYEAGQHAEAVERSGRLWLASGGRYRFDLMDEDGERTLDISDGQSVWAIQDGEAYRVNAVGAVIPLAELLNPAWLLAAYRLEITGRREHAGRVGFAITGYERDTSRSSRGGLPGGQVTAVVDAELGILLRYNKRGLGIRTESAEFSEFEVQNPELADSALFSCPEGIRVTEEGPPPTLSADSVGENGGTGESVNDDLIGQLYDAGLRQRRFSAVLRERADGDAIGAILRAEGSAGGKATRQLMELAANLTENVDLTARLQMDIPGRFRIEVLTGVSRGATHIVCDGEHFWQVYADRIVQRPAAPPPAGFSRLLDPAWLLDGYRLSPGGRELVSGRPGLRFTAKPSSDDGGTGSGVMSRTYFPYDEVDVVIDEEFGVALRLSWSSEGQLLFTAELADLDGEVEQDAFAFEPPPGIPVHANPFAAITAKDVAGTAVKAVKLAASIGKWMRKSQP